MVKAVRETKVFLPGQRSTILAFTDLHFSKYFGAEELAKMLEILRDAIRAEKVEYICFLGDLVDSLAVIDDEELWRELSDFLESVAELAPVVTVLGNHDYSRYAGKRALLDLGSAVELKRRLGKIPGVHLLNDTEIFDDGKVRMLGVKLPEECYHFSNFQSTKSAKVAFWQKMMESLPKLKQVPGREYYILLHSSRFLKEVQIDADEVVLSGHMHDGVMPPVLDKLTRVSGRGLVGPGFNKENGKWMHYEVLPWNARLRPHTGRLWMTLRPVTYLPRNRKVGKLNRMFPEISYTVIKGGAERVKVEEKLLGV